MNPRYGRSGERSDIVRTLQRTFAGESRELVIFDVNRAEAAVVGRLAAKGIGDELHDRPYALIDGIDGRAHHVTLPTGTNLAELPIGAIVKASIAGERKIDQTIAAAVREGVYRPTEHERQLRLTRDSGLEPDALLSACVRRLEALRRVGIVDRRPDGSWQIPQDLSTRGQRYDRGRLREAPLSVLSYLPLEKQTRAIGATWLDQQLVQGSTGVVNVNFGAVVEKGWRSGRRFSWSMAMSVAQDGT